MRVCAPAHGNVFTYLFILTIYGEDWGDPPRDASAMNWVSGKCRRCSWRKTQENCAAERIASTRKLSSDVDRRRQKASSPTGNTKQWQHYPSKSVQRSRTGIWDYKLHYSSLILVNSLSLRWILRVYPNICFLRVFKCFTSYLILSSSSGQSSWLLPQRSRLRFRPYHIFWVAVGLERGPLSPCEDKWGATWKKSSGSGLENWD
jgi:hypothetical protein